MSRYRESAFERTKNRVGLAIERKLRGKHFACGCYLHAEGERATLDYVCSEHTPKDDNEAPRADAER